MHSENDTFKCNENIVEAPWDIETVTLFVTRHFSKKYLSRWGWSYESLRDAFRNAYTINKTGAEKYEVYVNKGGYKKIICVYYSCENRIICITGSKGDRRI